MLRANAPIKALQIPQRSLKPLTNKAASPKIKPLITKENKPKVRNVIGKAIKDSMGCRIALSIPKTMAATKPFLTVSTSTPVGSLEIINKLIVVTIREIRIAKMLLISLNPKS